MCRPNLQYSGTYLLIFLPERQILLGCNLHDLYSRAIISLSRHFFIKKINTAEPKMADIQISQMSCEFQFSAKLWLTL